MLGVIFFENKLLLQPDVVFDSESNGRNFSSLAPPGGEKNFGKNPKNHPKCFFKLAFAQKISDKNFHAYSFFSRHQVALES